MFRMILVRLLALLALLAAPTAALAQDTTASELQGSMVQMFSEGDIIIFNQRGDGNSDGPNDWYMARQVTSAQATGACFLQLNTTTLEATPGINVAPGYAIDWSQVSEVDYDENFVTFKAAHMADNEYGALIVSSPELAEMLWAVFDFMLEAC